MILRFAVRVVNASVTATLVKVSLKNQRGGTGIDGLPTFFSCRPLTGQPIICPLRALYLTAPVRR